MKKNKKQFNLPNPYALRLILKLTEEEFCSFFCIDSETYWKWLQREKSPTPSQRFIMALAFEDFLEKRSF